MVSLFLLLGCNLSYIADLFTALYALVSACARTFLKLASLVCALLKPYGDILKGVGIPAYIIVKLLLIKRGFKQNWELKIERLS